MLTRLNVNKDGSLPPKRKDTNRVGLRLSDPAQMRASDVDRFGFNEAFASVTMVAGESYWYFVGSR